MVLLHKFKFFIGNDLDSLDGEKEILELVKLLKTFRLDIF